MRLFCKSCHITLHHTHELWSLIYLCAMRIMPPPPMCHCTRYENTNDVMPASSTMDSLASQLSLGIYDAPKIYILAYIHAN